MDAFAAVGENGEHGDVLWRHIWTESDWKVENESRPIEGLLSSLST